MDFLSLHNSHVVPDLTEEIDPEFDFQKEVLLITNLEMWPEAFK